MFVPNIQPAREVFPLVPTFTRTSVCFLLSELQPAPHKGVGILPEEPLQSLQNVPGKPGKLMLLTPAEVGQSWGKGI